MFSTSKRPEHGDDSYAAPGRAGSGTTIIARGVRVEGDFTSQGDVVIEGEVNGKIAASGLLTIGAEAKLRAEVKAENATIAGTVEGPVTVSKRLELKSSADVKGDILCETIVIEGGAMLQGRVDCVGGGETPAETS